MEAFLSQIFDSQAIVWLAINGLLYIVASI